MSESRLKQCLLLIALVVSILVVILYATKRDQLEDRSRRGCHQLWEMTKQNSMVEKGRTSDRNWPKEKRIHHQTQNNTELKLELHKKVTWDILLKEIYQDTSFWPSPKSVKKDTGLRWVKDTLKVLGNWKSGGQITLLLANSAVADLLLNWLIIATMRKSVNLDSILVIAMDKTILDMMHEKGIKTVLIPDNEWLSKRLRFRSIRGLIRLCATRLLNYLGYDVLMFDIDALPLKSLQPLFDQYSSSTLVGSMGIFPVPLNKKWNASTLCTGVLLIRSGKNAELLWKQISENDKNVGFLTDQKVLNYGLDSMNVKWTTNQTTGDQEGLCCMGQITLALITNSKICRSNCNSKHVHSYYVWHKPKVGLKQKNKSMEMEHLWYLDKEWNKKNCSDYEGIKWPKCLSNIESL